MGVMLAVDGPFGQSDRSVELPAEIFDVEVNVPLIHQVVVGQLAAARQGTRATKTRGDVRGGGRKPYPQKGTGRARQGSTRAPQFVGGGVVHGPQPRDYSQRTPKKMKAGALRGALSDRARHGQIHVLSGIVEGNKPSTRSAAELLGGVTERPHLLVVLDRGDTVSMLSVRNLADVHVLTADQLNTYDVLCADDVVFTEAAFKEFVQRVLPGRFGNGNSSNTDPAGAPTAGRPDALLTKDRQRRRPRPLDLASLNEMVVEMPLVRMHQRADDRVQGTAYEADGVATVALEQHDEYVLVSWPTSLDAHGALKALLASAAAAPRLQEVSLYAQTANHWYQFEDGDPIDGDRLRSNAAELQLVRLELEDETLMWHVPEADDDGGPRFVALERHLTSERLSELVDGTTGPSVHSLIEKIFGDEPWYMDPLTVSS